MVSVTGRARDGDARHTRLAVVSAFERMIRGCPSLDIVSQARPTYVQDQQGNKHVVIETLDDEADDSLASSLFGQVVDGREETEFLEQSTSISDAVQAKGSREDSLHALTVLGQHPQDMEVAMSQCLVDSLFDKDRR